MKKQIMYFMTLVLLSCSHDTFISQEGTRFDSPVVTADASNITQDSAILKGYVNPSEIIPGVEIGFIIASSENPSLENGIKLACQELDNNNMFFVEVKGLGSNTKYFYKAFLSFGDTYRVGDIKSFITEIATFEAVDLGLSVKWANMNLGSTSIDGYGDYFAWGETETKSNYGWSTYKFGTDKSISLSKYDTIGPNGENNYRSVLEPEDDVAHMKLGNKWRMPTYEEWMELKNLCLWEWSTQNGVYGMRVTSKKNSNSIFLPAAGHFYDTAYLVRLRGTYWSSSLYEIDQYKALCMMFQYDYNVNVGYAAYDRCTGLSVRAVSE